MEAVAPNESEGVGVCVGVGVAVVPKERDGVGVLLGVDVPDAEGDKEGAADKENPVAVRTHGVPPFGFVALIDGT
jgi:hypothetical protein